VGLFITWNVTASSYDCASQNAWTGNLRKEKPARRDDIAAGSCRLSIGSACTTLGCKERIR
jgi:hypothetical protein